MDINYQELGKKIKKARGNVGLSQEALAEKVNLSITHISNIENGNSKVSLNSVLAIADALNVTMDYLLRNSSMNRTTSKFNISHIFDDCSESEADFLFALLLKAKEILREFTDNEN